MSNANSIRAGGAFVELFAENSKLVRGLRAAEKHVKDFGGKVSKIGKETFSTGAAAASALAGTGKIFASIGDDVAHAAKRTGMSAEAFSGLAYAAKMSDISAEDFEGGLRKMQKTLSAAAGGSKSAQEKLSDLGLSVEDLLKLSPDQQFSLIADRLTRIKNPAMQAGAAMGIFGRGGASLLPLLQEGSAGIARFVAEAKRLGLIVSTSDAKAAEEFDEALKRMWMTIKMVAFNIGSALAPTLKDAARWLTDVAVNTSRWVKENRGLAVMALQASVALAAVGASIFVVGKAISAVSGAFTALRVIVGAFQAIASVISLVASPIGMIAIGILVVTTALLQLTGNFDSAIAAMKDGFAAIKADALATFGGMADALAAGDLALAVKILWLGLRTEWQRGVNFLLNMWDSFCAALAKVVNTAWTGIIAYFHIAVSVWQTLWDRSIFFMAGAWDGFVLTITQGWETVKAAAAKAWNYVRGMWNRDFNVEAANRAVDAAKKAAIDQARRNVGDNYARREKEMEDRATARGERLREIAQEWKGVNGEIDMELADKIGQREDELNKAIAERDAAIAQAKEAAKRVRVRRELEDFFGDIDSYSPKTGGKTGDMIRRVAEVRGTFSPYAMFGFGYAGNAQERTAKAAEKTAKHTERIEQLIEDDDGMRFE